MRHTFSTWLAGAMLFSVFLSIQAAEGDTKNYRNPIISGFYPDPSAVRVGDDYFMVNSSFQFFPAVPFWHSKDLIHWEQIGSVLNKNLQIPLKGANNRKGIYAPTLRYHEGRFYMVTTNVCDGPNGGNFFVYTDEAEVRRYLSGNHTTPIRWSAPFSLEQGGIDPSFLFADGKCYMTSNPNDGIWLCEIDPETGMTLHPSKCIWKGTGGRYPEAPHLYKKDGMYYLMIAEGGTEMGHMVTIARSKSPYGPYEANPNNPILCHQRQLTQNNAIQGTGHADLVQAADSSWWMVCLGYRPTTDLNHHLGRETFLAPVEWNEQGWPVVNGNGTIDTLMKVPTLPQHEYPGLFTHDDFSNGLGNEWVFLCNPDSNCYMLDEKGIVLKARPGSTLDVEGSTLSFVARRQQDINCVFGTEVSLNGDTGEAGLTVYAAGKSHYDLYIQAVDGLTQQLCFRCRLNDITQLYTIELPEPEPVRLRVTANAERYTFSYCLKSGGWRNFGTANTRYLSSEVAGGFTGTVIGLYSVAPEDGTEGTFTYFDYEAK